VNALADFAVYDMRADFSAQLRRLMKLRGVTCPRLAAATGLCRRQVQRIVYGTSGPHLRHLAAIARELRAELKIELVPKRNRPAWSGKTEWP